MKNPFEFGRELGTEELVDREEEIQAVKNTIIQGGKLFLIGPRRFGKTSILRAAQDQLTKQNAVILRFNAENYPDIEQLVAAIISEAARQLKGTVERKGEQLRQFFAALRPDLSFDLTESRWKVALGLKTDSTANKSTDLLINTLTGLEQMALAQPAERPVGLMIDEFQALVAEGGIKIERQLRGTIQQHRRVGYVFAGSKTRLLAAMTLDPARPFYRLGSARFIGTVPRADFAAFLREKFTQSGFGIEAPVGNKVGPIDLLLELAEEVPYNIQHLAHQCWNQLRSEPGKGPVILTPQTVESALEFVVRSLDPLYTQLWKGLTVIQQKTLIAVLQEAGNNLLSARVTQAIGKGASTVKRALTALLERDLLREEEQSGTVRYRFEDPFFAQWIRLFSVH
jgi:uncharacterized protein